MTASKLLMMLCLYYTSYSIFDVTAYSKFNIDYKKHQFNEITSHCCRMAIVL